MTARALTTIYLVRHGQSESNNQRRVTGQLDVPLSAKGVAQSEALARLLDEEPLKAIYTSALNRAIETAAPAARRHGLKSVPMPALNEINMGVLHGRFRDERDAEAAAIWQRWQSAMWRYRVPGGESFAELQARVEFALRRILTQHEGDSVLIAAHRGTNRVLLGLLLQLPKEQWPLLLPSAKVVHRIVVQNGDAIELVHHQELKLPRERSHDAEQRSVSI